MKRLLEEDEHFLFDCVKETIKEETMKVTDLMKIFVSFKQSSHQLKCSSYLKVISSSNYASSIIASMRQHLTNEIEVLNQIIVGMEEVIRDLSVVKDNNNRIMGDIQKLSSIGGGSFSQFIHFESVEKSPLRICNDDVIADIDIYKNRDEIQTQLTVSIQKSEIDKQFDKQINLNTKFGP